jgi:hypothetical protein
LGKSRDLSVETGIRNGREVEAKTCSEELGGLPAGERIQIDGREEVFVVLRTDRDRRTVDVLQISGLRQIVGGIPLASVRVLNDRNPLALMLGSEVDSLLF